MFSGQYLVTTLHFWKYISKMDNTKLTVEIKNSESSMTDRIRFAEMLEKKEKEVTSDVVAYGKFIYIYL